MFNLKVIQHKDLSQILLDEIIQIKSIAWPYPYQKQIEWMDIHLKDSDFHLLLLIRNKAVAYLNLIAIKILIDNSVIDALGVGNVCAIEKGKGYGSELLKQTNKFIIENKNIGLLFCKNNLINFYMKNSWNFIEKNQLNLVFDSKNIETMIFNYKLPFTKLTFDGMSF